MGAYLSVLDTFYNSRDLRGTAPWQPVSFWVKTGSIDTSLQIACRVGGYSSLNTGRGWCTGISLLAAGTRPALLVGELPRLEDYPPEILSSQAADYRPLRS